MFDAQTFEVVREALGADWVGRLEAGRLLMGPRVAARSALDGWLDHLGSAALGDESATHELFKQVAFHARSLGLDGRPASAIVGQCTALADAVDAQLIETPAPLTALLRQVLGVAVDAHSLGRSQRDAAGFERQLRDGSPIFRLDERTVVGFVLGPMTAGVIDALMGRLLRECGRMHAEVAVVDIFGADQDDDRFHRTVKDFVRAKASVGARLIVTGARDVSATQVALETLGVDLDRVEVLENIQLFFDAHAQQNV